MLREVLFKIGDEQSKARGEGFAGHPLGHLVRNDAPKVISNILSDQYNSWKSKGSIGQGRWADVIWVTIFNPLVTTSAQRGYYIVYLFHPSKRLVYLSLNQGATAIYEEFKSKAPEVLRERAAFMKSRIKDHVKPSHIHGIELGSTQSLPVGYESGHIIGHSYDLDHLPSESQLLDDLVLICGAYAALEYRGGAEDLAEANLGDDLETDNFRTISETRSYRAHRKIERNSEASKKVKKFHGYDCMACKINFSDTYGKLGEGYIEAHHLRPLHTLEQGITSVYDIEKDFVVLCSNCHRMIHRQDDPSNLELLKQTINKYR